VLFGYAVMLYETVKAFYPELLQNLVGKGRDVDVRGNQERPPELERLLP
jgi:hypothetical protein